MKKVGLIGMAALMLGISTINTSCMGSWGMTKVVYEWNEKATGNRFIDNLIFWVIAGIQVYSITLMIDMFILNLIEFWTGSNPIAMNEGDREQQIVKGKDGNEYQITATKNRFEIVTLTGDKKGEMNALVYTPANKTWNKEVKNEELVPVFAMHEDLNKVELFATDGSVRMVDMGSLYVNSTN